MRQGNEELVEYMVRHGARADAAVMHAAAQSGAFGAITRSLGRGDATCERALHDSLLAGDFDEAERLSRPGMQLPVAVVSAACRQAVSRPGLDALRTLLRIVPTAKDEALYWSAKRRRPDVMRLALDLGGRAARWGGVLTNVLLHDDTALAVLLIDSGAEGLRADDCVLVRVCQEGAWASARFVLARTEPRQEALDAALVLAADAGELELVGILRQRGADPASGGRAAVYAAVCGGHLDVYDALC